MAAEDSFCKFHQFGHCKFGPTCRKFHTKDTCSNFKCTMVACSSRHPKQCKFYMLYGRCKFADNCSYLHVPTRNTIENALSQEIESLKVEVKLLKSENIEMKSKLSRLDTIEQDIRCLKEDGIGKSDSFSEKKHACDVCDYKANTATVLKRHKTMKHKNKNTSPQDPIACVREDMGCKETVNKYFDKNTAICQNCKEMLDKMWKSCPFPPTLCPCCHNTSNGSSFSFCQECLDCLYQDGSMDSGWGFWSLDRNADEIIRTHLDFEIL